MSSHNPLGSAFDRAIERAVREMTQGDPRPGFSRRVLRRIERNRGFGPSLVSLGWVARAAALAAAVVLVVVTALMLGDSPGREATPATPARTATPPAPALPADAPSGEAIVESASSPAAPAAAPAAPTVPGEPAPEMIFGPRRNTIAAASVETFDREEPALVMPEWNPAFDQTSAITIEPIRITPIAIPPLAVTRSDR